MPQITDVINSFSDLTNHLIPKSYLPAIYNVAFKRKRSWFCNRVPRSSEDVDGLKVHLTFLKKLPWSWRSMSEFGYTPTGSKFDSAEGSAQLGCHAASAIVSLTELEATEQGRWTNILDKQMMALSETFPYYLRSLLWTSQNSQKALGKVASIDSTTVTLDNAGLWNTETIDRAKLFETGMFVQAYRSTAKVGSPVEVTAVDKTLGTVTLASDPGLADNDVLVCSDIAGLDTPYSSLCPGILDVIDNDNTFQGINRSTSGNEAFQAYVKDASAETFGYELISDFLHECYNPDEAFTHWKVIRKYFTDNFQANVRYNDARTFEDGYEYLLIDKTKLYEDEDCDSDKMIVPDFANMQLADRGAVEPLFGDGWQRVAGRPFLQYDVVYWALLLARDCRYMGVMDNISLT